VTRVHVHEATFHLREARSHVQAMGLLRVADKVQGLVNEMEAIRRMVDKHNALARDLARTRKRRRVGR
jgi:hypothetical protein